MEKRIKVGGRQKGSLNKITSHFKQAVQIVYEDIGGHEAFANWAREHPSEFYRIAAKLIPSESAEKQPTGPVTVKIVIGSVKIPDRSKTIEHEPALLNHVD
jgi:hypothetical protein